MKIKDLRSALAAFGDDDEVRLVPTPTRNHPDESPDAPRHIGADPRCFATVWLSTPGDDPTPYVELAPSPIKRRSL